MTPQQFIAKWQDSELSEHSACQQHFLDLCDLLHQAKPAEVDKDGSYYTFERGVSKNDGGKGWADVWLRGKFGWEYKGKHKDLRAAYQQLLKYRESLENPPLLVVCDLDRFEVHTNFTDTIKQEHHFDLQGLNDPKNLQILRSVFTNPEALKPGQTPESITQKVAERFAELSDGMQKRGVEPFKAAHFLMKLMFCMFSEDIELLPKDLFTKTVANSKSDPKKLSKLLKNLFEAMEKGGEFGPEIIEWFNGGLFADSEVIDLTPIEIKELFGAAHADWSNVEPTIFGTLFERTLDPDKRSQIGAHYTSRADIETLLNPVMMDPLRREWADVKDKAEKLYAKVTAGGSKQVVANARKAFNKCLEDFRDRLAHVQVLDPACGSGNFLYVAINLLLNLEKEVITYASTHDLSLHPLVRPTQLHGLEINTYAAELAQVVIWIGFLQWMHFNGFVLPRDPVLQNVNSIVQGDAIIDLSDPANPKEPEWPEAEFIVGNPPFLGNRLMAAYLPRDYIEALSSVYEKRLGGRPDLCCYWFEKARSQIENRRCKRAGLLATQGIRGGTNRNILTRIKESGDIFFAVSDRDWILNGASVHISMIGFDAGDENHRLLDGTSVPDINANLTSGANTVSARTLSENAGIAFQGAIKRGSFDVAESEAMRFLHVGGNPHRLPNSDVILPYFNGLDVTRRPRRVWVVDFGPQTAETEASRYEAPFEYVRSAVFPERQRANQAVARERWWLHWCSRPQMNAALADCERFIVTPRVAKHRVFTWLTAPAYVDCQLIAFARSDDYTLGVLHSRVHEVWARSQGTQVRERESGFRYTPTSCFDTFPFPNATTKQRVAISTAARNLNELRDNWLNPPEWTDTEWLSFPGSASGPWSRYLEETDSNGVGTVRYPRQVPRDSRAAELLKKRTLTALYNEMPTWLAKAHIELDESVFAAYGWEPTLSNETILDNLLALNHARGAGSATAMHVAVENDDGFED